MAIDLLKTLGESKLVAMILENEALMNALLKALSVSLNAKEQVEAHYEQTLNNMGLAPLARLRAAEEELKGFEEELVELRAQLTRLSSEARSGREASDELKATRAVMEQVEAALHHSKAEVKRSQEEQERMQSSLEAAYEEITALRARLGEGEPSPAQTSTSSSSPSASSPSKPASTTWSATMSKAHLLELAQSLQLGAKAAMKKAEIVELLRAASKSVGWLSEDA